MKRKNECCNDERNLDVVIDGSKKIETCRVCGCRHFTFKVDPIKVKMT